MSPRSPRKFTILDGMILVAAVACGFALRRLTTGIFNGGVFESLNWLGRNAIEPMRAAMPFLATLTPAVLLIRLRRPRPALWRLARQPGMAACCAAILSMPPTLLALARENRAVVEGESEVFPPDWVARIFLLEEGAVMAGLWVLAAWAALMLGGRRRPERGWIDRLGRVVGLGWLLALAVHVLGHDSTWW
jgi:hypothetical protein